MKISIVTGLIILTFCLGCESEFLNLKRDKMQVIPASGDDYKAILDSYLINYNSSHLLGEVGSDDYSLSSSLWKTIGNSTERNAYLWADQVYEGSPGTDWNRGYEKVLYANFVLEGMNTIETGKVFARNETVGYAYFVRGSAFFNLAQLFCQQYNGAKASESLGLPLRITSDVNVKYKRSSLEQTYERILEDLKSSVHHLPATAESNTRPSRSAAYAMLSKTYLQMGNYVASLAYADSSLALQSDLIDYNTIEIASGSPFPLYGRGNKEILYYSSMPGSYILLSQIKIDQSLYSSYDSGDIRKDAFYTGNAIITFKGSYSGMRAFMFSGLTTAEMYLVYAESSARLGRVEEGKRVLQSLLIKRYTTDGDLGLESIKNASQLMERILMERRKELIFRGVRWNDLRRLNELDNANISLSRFIDGEEIVLRPFSNKWVWPIPDDAIALGGILQNER